MRTLITLALFLIIGFAGSRGYVARATNRLPLAGLLASGVEFFLLGLLAGPGGFNLITGDVLLDLEPIVYLALGWIGLLFGIEMSWEQVQRISREVYRFLIVDLAVSLTAFTGLMFVLVRLLWPGHPVEAVVASVIFGITASISSPMIVALVSQRLPSRGPLTNTARIAGALSALFPLLAFGVLFMVVHSGFYTFGGLGSGLLWWLFVNIFGIVMGFIMVLFTHERTSDDEMLLLITGTVLLIGGVCYFLELPSLYTSMIMGFVVGNFARRRDQIFRELHVIEKTLFVAFLIMVGAMVAPPSVSTALVVATYVVLRLALKYFVTGRSAMKRFPGLRSHGPRVGLVMSAQGVMAMAVALDFELAAPVFDGIRPLSVVCYAVIINDVIGYALTRRVLVAAGEARSTPQRRQGTP